MEDAPQEQEPNLEAIDSEIGSLLETLGDYVELYDQLPELQEEWYWADMEARVSRDRVKAKAQLEEFIKKLESLKK